MTLGYIDPRPRPTLRELEGRQTSAMSEATLLVGYADVARKVEPCVCGGVIATVDTPRAIQYALELHNRTPAHVAWRDREGL
jgi:hypothetical protein